MLSRTAVLKDWLLATLPDQVRDQECVLADWKPDVIISDVTMWGTPLVLHELRGVPCVICSFAPGCMIPSPNAPPWGMGLPSPHNWWTRVLSRTASLITDMSVAGFRRKGNELRAGFGLPPLEAPIHEHFGKMPLYFVPSVPELDFHRNDLPPSVRYIGPLIWNDTYSAGPDERLATISHERPWIHVRRGPCTSRNFPAPSCRRRTCQSADGSNHDHGRQSRPENVGSGCAGAECPVGVMDPSYRTVQAHRRSCYYRRCGHDPGRSRSRHSSVGRTTAWDKADNAQRVVEAGAAIRISPGRCSPKRLRACVERLLVDKIYVNNAKRLARTLKGFDGPRKAVELLEETFPCRQ